MTRRIITLVLLIMVPLAVTKADQLPALPNLQQIICANSFNGILAQLTQARDYFYDLGTRDRDQLAKKMVEFSGTTIDTFRNWCPADSAYFPDDAVKAMAYHIIAKRFGESGSR